LHALLLSAAQHWVFASLHSQPLQVPDLRAQITRAVTDAGYPQMLLSLGRARVAPTTPRRPVVETIDQPQSATTD
jgi:hypothetical protein